MTAGRAYLDWNASAPLRPVARDAMLAALEMTGNASSVHAEGRKARAVVEEAREQVAALVGAKPADVVFTSGATESNNGVLRGGWSTIYLSGIEHDSVRGPAQASGAGLVDLPVGMDGIVQVEAAEFANKPSGRCLMALQMANNETGVVQPVAQAVALAHGLALHTDATQAAGRVAIDMQALGVDTLAISSHKIGGPKGVGALIVRDGYSLPAFIAGGGQERRRRAGTENVAAVAGFGAAAAAAQDGLQRMGELAARRDAIERELVRLAPETIVVAQASPRLPNTICVALPGQLAETLVIKLDLAGIAVSAGAACSSGKVGASRTLAAMGLPADIARGAVRVSIGLETSDQEIQRLFAAWSELRRPRGAESRSGETAIPHAMRTRVERMPERV
jgi:cysteine desulfurase